MPVWLITPDDFFAHTAARNMVSRSFRSTTFVSAVVILLAGVSCRAGKDDSKCTATAPLSATAFTPDRINLLVGEFDLEQVNTADETLIDKTVDTHLKVELADTARRLKSLEHRLGHIPRKIQLVGTRMIPPRSSVDSAEFDDGHFTVGCIDCSNTSPDYFYVTTVNEKGFWGNWVNNRTGSTTFFVNDDPNAPHPAGFFCAMRSK